MANAEFLPGGQIIVHTVRSSAAGTTAVAATSLDSGESRILVDGASTLATWPAT